MAEKQLDQPRLLWRRFWAGLVDIVIVAVATPLVNEFLLEASLIAESHLVIIFLVATIVYHTYCEGPWGWTPGKLLLGIEVVREGTNEPPGMIRAFLRSVLRLVDGLFGYIVGWAVAMDSAKGQRLGDKAAGTLVVRDRASRHRTPGYYEPRYAPPRTGPSAGERRQQEKEARFRAGKVGERKVGKELSQLCEEDYFYVFNDLPETVVGNLDHLVIGPCGLILIETKANQGALTLAAAAPVLINGQPLKRDPLQQLNKQMRALDERFDYETGFHPRRTVSEFLGKEGHHWILCFSRAWVEGSVGERRARQVVTLDNLQHRIRSYEAVFNQGEIDYLARQVRDSYGRLPDSVPGSGTDVERAGAS